MTLPLIFCLIATVVPVFFSKISSAPTWLSLQAMALGWITINYSEELSLHAVLVGLTPLAPISIYTLPLGKLSG